VLAAAQCGPNSPYRAYTIMSGIGSPLTLAITIWANYSLESETPILCGRRIEAELHKLIPIPHGHEDDPMWQYNRVRIYKGTVQIALPVPRPSITACRELDAAVAQIIEDNLNRLVNLEENDLNAPIKLRLMSDIGPVPGWGELRGRLAVVKAIEENQP